MRGCWQDCCPTARSNWHHKQTPPFLQNIQSSNPPLREDPSSHMHQHRAQELICSMTAWVSSHAVFSSGIQIFLLGFGGKFFWLGKVSRRLFYSIFTPVLPVVDCAPKTQQHEGGKGTRGIKGKLVEHKSPKHDSCTSPRPVSDLNKSHIHTYLSFLTYSNSRVLSWPFSPPILSKGWHSLTDVLLDLLHLYHPDFHPSKEPHTLMGIWDPSYGLNDPGLFPKVHSKARNTSRLSHSPSAPSSAFIPSPHSPKHPLKANGN